MNNSGGLVLLKYLVEKALELRTDVFFLLDARCEKVFAHVPEERKRILEASYGNRRKFYTENKTRISAAFCFGNIPPPIRLRCAVYTYLHNPLLLATPPGYPIKEKIIKFLKTSFIRMHLGNTDGIFIQTSFMADQLRSQWNYPTSKTHSFPFYDVRVFSPLRNQPKDPDYYLFINDGNPHKNHLNLLKAWAIVNKSRPEWCLHLTVTDRFPELRAAIQQYIDQGVNLVNHGFVDPVSVYSLCQYLVYPSLTESFGLGLLEGAAAGLSILSSDLPYAHAVVRPSACFDPTSPQHIAKTILEQRLENPGFQQTKLITPDRVEDLLAMF